MIIIHRKDLLIGDYLIHYRTARGAGDFCGVHLHFGQDYQNNYRDNDFPNWNEIIAYFELV